MFVFDTGSDAANPYRIDRAEAVLDAATAPAAHCDLIRDPEPAAVATIHEPELDL